MLIEYNNKPLSQCLKQGQLAQQTAQRVRNEIKSSKISPHISEQKQATLRMKTTQSK